MFKRLLRALFRKKRPQFYHPELGLITLDAKLWKGQAQRHNREICFGVAGSDSAPDGSLLEQFQKLLSENGEAEQGALALICAQKRHFNPRDFSLKSVEFARVGKPAAFVMKFSMEGDEDGFWQVVFENGRPKDLGRERLK